MPSAGRQVWPTRIEPHQTGTGEQWAVPPPAGEQGPHPAHSAAHEPAGPPLPPDDGGPATPRPRRRRTLVLAVVAAVLVLAAGGVSVVPEVSNRLGLPWAPNLPLNDPPAPQGAELALGAPQDSSATPTPSGVADAIGGLATDPAFDVLTGSVIDPASGTVLWEREPGQVRTPASTTKLLTAAAALLALDHDMRLPTTVVEGPEPGTVVLVGGGDVTLSSLPNGQDSIFPGAAQLDGLVEQVREATGGEVSRVELDTSLFSGPVEGPGWAPEDVPSTFMVNVEPAMLDGGRTDPTAGNSMGRSDPAGHLAEEFAERLGARTGGTITAAEGAKVLGEVHSPPVEELVRQSLITSDNLLSEVLGRQVAIAEGKPASFEGAAEATLEVLSRNGINVDNVELYDNSGLSPQNKLSASMLTELLALAASPDGNNEVATSLRPMLIGLPVAGGSGTLTSRYDQEPAKQGRGWVRAKTGSLPGEQGVHTLAGSVLTSEGRVLAFSLMGVGSDTDAVRAALDRIAAQLRGCGCR